MKKAIKYIFIVVLIVIFSISIFFICKDLKEDYEQEDIINEIQDISIKDEIQENKSKENNNNETDIDFTQLKKINTDIVGWLKIDKSNINYPIMQRKSNPNYYLRRNFYKEYSQWGTPFLARSCDMEKSDNLIVYGHHIRGNKMFGELENYRKKSYYEEHKNIKIYTLNDIKEYEIISVFQTIAYTGFRYYDYINMQYESEFNAFVSKCKELAFFDIKDTAKYGDKLLTLSTCDYTSKNSRLVVIAKQK